MLTTHLYLLNHQPRLLGLPFRQNLQARVGGVRQESIPSCNQKSWYAYASQVLLVQLIYALATPL